MGTKFFVHSSGQWCELDCVSGTVTGWREKPRFLYVSRGRLVMARSKSVLRGLRALLAGCPNTVREGTILPQQRLNISNDTKDEPKTSHQHCCCFNFNRCLNSSNIVKQNVDAEIQPDISIKKISNDVPLTLQRKDAVDSCCDKSSPKKPNATCGSMEIENLKISVNTKNNTEKDITDILNSISSSNKKKHGIHYNDSVEKNFRELVIYEEDVNVVRNFLLKNSSSINLYRFDSDDDFKKKIFYKINPVVFIGRSDRYENYLDKKELDNDNISVHDFASVLGLTHTVNATKFNKRYKTRNAIMERNKIVNNKKDKVDNFFLGAMNKENTKDNDDNCRYNEQNKENNARSLKNSIKHTPNSKKTNVDSTSGSETDSDIKKFKNTQMSSSKETSSSESELNTSRNLRIRKNKSNVNDKNRESLISSTESKTEQRNKQTKLSNGNIFSQNKKKDNKYLNINTQRRLTMNKSNVQSSTESDTDLELEKNKRSKLTKLRLKENSFSVSKDKNIKSPKLNTQKRSTLNRSNVLSGTESDSIAISSSESEQQGSKQPTSSSTDTETDSEIEKRKNRKKIKLPTSKSPRMKAHKSSLDIKSKTIKKTRKISNKKLVENTSDSDSSKDIDKENEDLSENNKIKNKKVTNKAIEKALEELIGDKLTIKKISSPAKNSPSNKQDSDKAGILKFLKPKNDIKNSSKRKQKNSTVSDSSDTERSKHDGKHKAVGPKSSLEKFKQLNQKLQAKKGFNVVNGYSSLEDQAIVAWVSVNGRERLVNGNVIWRDLQGQYQNITGKGRSWHSLRNRYLRYILPTLGSLALPPDVVSRLRASAARGCIKSRDRPPSPVARAPSPAGAWARRPRSPAKRQLSESETEERPRKRLLRSSLVEQKTPSPTKQKDSVNSREIIEPIPSCSGEAKKKSTRQSVPKARDSDSLSSDEEPMKETSRSSIAQRMPKLRKLFNPKAL